MLAFLESEVGKKRQNRTATFGLSNFFFYRRVASVMLCNHAFFWYLRFLLFSITTKLRVEAGHHSDTSFNEQGFCLLPSECDVLYHMLFILSFLTVKILKINTKNNYRSCPTTGTVGF